MSEQQEPPAVQEIRQRVKESLSRTMQEALETGHRLPDEDTRNKVVYALAEECLSLAAYVTMMVDRELVARGAPFNADPEVRLENWLSVFAELLEKADDALLILDATDTREVKR